MNDYEMAKQLTDIGYDVDLVVESYSYDEGLVAEMAIKEGYEWNESQEVWFNEETKHLAPFKCPLCESDSMEYREIKNNKALSGLTHKWVCEECPAVLFEYYTQADIEAL